ncbi:MAG: Hsp20/alpha crystallin family protein [Anaerolineaceae bacterium]|nr:Hsp20/alpha crystallin family protein [Anaerolineaceae bacterium]
MYRKFQNNSIWNEMDRLQRDMNLFMNAYMPSARASAHAFPAVNLWNSEDQAVVTVEIPGVKQDDLDIMLTGDTLTIKGSRNPDDIAENAVPHRQERGNGQFTRTLRLPFPVESEKVDAKLKSGVLQIHLPRASHDMPRKISVSSLN